MATLTVQGYRATRTDSDLTIHRVPIFCTCTRGELEFDAKWVNAAVSKAQQLERETGYLPPLHIRHHEAGTAVRAAGYFRVLGTEPLTLKGEQRTAIMADLVITDPATIAEVLARRLPYRSVEIFDVGSPEINSLALLDHEAPFLQLPMLMVSSVEDVGGMPGVSGGTFSVYSPRDKQPALAYFRSGKTAQLLFREGYEMEDEMKPDAPEAAPVEAEETPEKPPEEAPQAEQPEEPKAADVDVKAVVAAIQSGSISVGDLDALLQAIQAMKGSQQEQQQQAPAPAPVPGGSQMKADDNSVVKMAALEGEVVALRSQLDGMKAASERRDAVAVAMKRLEGRALGANLEQRLVEYHEKHGAQAFQAHVDAMAQTFGIVPEKDFRGSLGAELPAVAMKYQDKGPGAVERAAKFAAEHAQLTRSGAAPVPLERYVEIHMARHERQQAARVG